MTKLVSTNPGKNYQVVGEVEVSSEQEIKSKVQKAHQTLDKWNELGLEGRVKLLKKVIDEFSKRKEDIALLETREMGMPISQSRMDVDEAVRYFNWYLENAKKFLESEVVYEDNSVIHKVFHEPIGVTAVIVPWNFPLSNFVWGCGQNLVVGNTIIFKHSEETPLTGKLIEKIVNGILPEGIFNEIYGDGSIGNLLVHQDINLICFTGSTKTGKYLYQVGAEKFIKVVLECGGSAPGIIFEDANLDKVLETVYFDRFINCGQACDALKRLIVHQSRIDEVIEKLKESLQKKKIGNPEREDTDIGSLVAKRQLNLLEEQVKDALDKGAKVVTGGKRPKDLEGAYFEPTLLTNVTENMRVWQEEVFGPVLPIISFRSEEEAISLANNTKYGLGSYVFTQDKKRASRIASQIQAGMVSINNASYLQPCSPFGGYKESGLGREHGRFGFEELTQVKVVAIDK